MRPQTLQERPRRVVAGLPAFVAPPGRPTRCTGRKTASYRPPLPSSGNPIRAAPPRSQFPFADPRSATAFPHPRPTAPHVPHAPSDRSTLQPAPGRHRTVLPSPAAFCSPGHPASYSVDYLGAVLRALRVPGRSRIPTPVRRPPAALRPVHSRPPPGGPYDGRRPRKGGPGASVC